MPAKDIEVRRATSRRCYEKNKEYYKQAVRIKKHRMRQWMREQKDKPCADCGIKYPYYVMDFDHREGVDKLSDVHALVRRNAWYKMRQEVAKCDAVCSNCHRIRTHWRRSAKQVQRSITPVP